MLATDGPVSEGGLAGEIVDTDPGQDHAAARHAELLRWRHLLWVLVQGQQGEEILLAPDLQGDKRQLELEPPGLFIIIT